MTDCGFSYWSLRWQQVVMISQHVSQKKKLKDVQYVYSAQTQQKGINKMASPISPPRRERVRFSSISSPCVTVQHRGPRHHAHTWLKPTAKLSNSARTCHRVSRNPMLQHASTSSLGSRCFVPRSLGFCEPFFRFGRISFSVWCVFLEPQRSCLQVSDLAHVPSRSNSTCCGSLRNLHHFLSCRDGWCLALHHD